MAGEKLRKTPCRPLCCARFRPHGNGCRLALAPDLATPAGTWLTGPAVGWSVLTRQSPRAAEPGAGRPGTWEAPLQGCPLPTPTAAPPGAAAERPRCGSPGPAAQPRPLAGSGVPLPNNHCEDQLVQLRAQMLPPPLPQGHGLGGNRDMFSELPPNQRRRGPLGDGKSNLNTV